MAKLPKNLISIALILANIAVWVVAYFYLLERPFILKSGPLALPKSFINDSLFYGMLINALIFYVNYFVLVNRLMTQSIMRYLAISGAGVLLLTVLETFVDSYLLDRLSAENFTLVAMLFNFNLAVHSFFWLLSATLKTSFNWIAQERLKDALDAQRIDAELNLLKSQIHPHFLFNTLNTLYSSAYQSGDNQTADGIGKLSHLLRYMLYETGSEKVSLDKEIEYLENYIELQQMRFENEVDVSFVTEGDTRYFKLAPMLLITLVENAFKHGISPSIKTQIKILLVIKDESHLIFSVENTKLNLRKNKLISNDVGGMGLQNLEKRLEMLYPNNHSFKTEIIDDKFVACLELT